LGEPTVVLPAYYFLTAAMEVQLMTTTPPTVEEPVRIGERKQLFVDDYIVTHKSNVARRLGTVKKEAQPLMVPNEQEYPLYFGVYSTVLRDDGKFKMWYLATNMPDYDIGYAESEDGIHWKRLNVGKDARDNFVFRGHGFSCFIDPNEKDPNHRYKGAYGPTGQWEKSQKAVHLAHSPDGIHWTAYNNGKTVLSRTFLPHPQIGGRSYVTASDTHNQMTWDGEAEVYLLFTRDIYQGPVEGDDRKVSRGSRSMTNPDVKANPTGWTQVRSWEFDREGADEYKRRQIYALTDWMYQGVHFGLMSVLRSGGLIDCYIGTSRDAASWDLSWVYAGKPFIPPGPKGSFDAAGAFPFSQIVTWKDRHWLYYGAMDKGHKDLENRMSIGLATLRLDGFVSLEAGPEAGVITTKPFILVGSQLELNVETPQGQISIEVLDATDQPIPGFAKADCQDIKGVDELRLRPKWRRHADLAPLNGEAIRLKFELQNARLYAFKVNP
jgi:hypothetical protein